MSTPRSSGKKSYMPISVSITETVRHLQSQGKMPLTFKGQAEAEALSAKINQKGPASTAANLRPGDEFDGSIVQLNITDIHQYDRNPRTSPNPKYHEIKASIREKRGLKGQLTVTKRPGDGKYILYMGGNTRLQIVRELYNETKDHCFSQINCVFHKWTSEADVLASHLIENEARGDTLFIEKARGLIELARELEKETGRRLSSRDVQVEVGRMGMTVRQPTVILYEFAVDHLLPLGPWLSHNNVNQIKQRYAQYQAVATTLDKTGVYLGQFPALALKQQQVFAELLSARQLALREAGDKATAVALRGETLAELLRGFDSLVADVLELDPDAGRRVFAALNDAGTEPLSAEILRSLISGDSAPLAPPRSSTTNPARSAPKRIPAEAATEKTDTSPEPLADAALGEPPTLVSDQGNGTANADSAEFPQPARLAWQEVLTKERYTEIGLYFFHKLKEWCNLTRIEQWLYDGTKLELPYHFYIELPDEIAERDVRLNDIRDPDHGLLDAEMLKIRSSSYRLTAMLSGQLGGIIEDENGHWTTEMAFAERLPADSPWRQAALVDYMTLGAFYNVWESQLGGVTTQNSCQCALAPHDFLIALHGPFAHTWVELTTAYLDWGRALTYWHKPTPTNDE